MANDITMRLRRNTSWENDGSIVGTLTVYKDDMLLEVFSTVERGTCFGPDYLRPSPYKPYVNWSKDYERFRFGIHPMMHSQKLTVPRIKCLRLARPCLQARCGILIHPASGPQDLAGCLAPFMRPVRTQSSSEVAMNKIWEFCGGYEENKQNVTLVVLNDYPG
jgi:hypothetical protein